MASFSQLLDGLQTIAPLELAEEWDNVGLLVDRSGDNIERVMTCLTLTPDVAAEAVEKKIDVIVSHHPIMFRPRQQITRESTEGSLLIQLIQANIAVYSPHTAYDSAGNGINAQLAEMLELQDVEPLRPYSSVSGSVSSALATTGSGRIGTLPSAISLTEFIRRVADLLPVAAGVQMVGEGSQTISRVGIACGSAAEFQTEAKQLSADVLLTGEARFHACLEARANQIALVIAGHYATERPGIEKLAQLISEKYPGISAVASEAETDPLQMHS